MLPADSGRSPRTLINGPRLSISFLLVVVLLIGIGMAALTHPSDLWSSFLFSMVMVALHTSIVGILMIRGRPRAFWIAFAVFGWGYWLMSSAPWVAREFRPNLLSDHLLTTIYPFVTDLPPGVALEDGRLVIDRSKLGPNGVDLNSSQLSFRHFKDIGHYLVNLILPLLAGYIAWLAVSKDRRDGEKVPSPPEGLIRS
jgi:hypothetical protein